MYLTRTMSLSTVWLLVNVTWWSVLQSIIDPDADVNRREYKQIYRFDWEENWVDFISNLVYCISFCFHGDRGISVGIEKREACAPMKKITGEATKKDKTRDCKSKEA